MRLHHYLKLWNRPLQRFTLSRNLCDLAQAASLLSLHSRSLSDCSSTCLFPRQLWGEYYLQNFRIIRKLSICYATHQQHIPDSSKLCMLSVFLLLLLFVLLPFFVVVVCLPPLPFRVLEQKTCVEKKIHCVLVSHTLQEPGTQEQRLFCKVH